MKRYKRVLGVDDGSFNRDRDTCTILVGVMARFDGYVEGVVTRNVVIDSLDSTNQIISMFDTHFGDQIDYVMLNGITFAGFNLCDISRLSEAVGKPVVSVTRRKPDIDSMASAIRKHFDDSEERISILRKTETQELEIRTGKRIHVNLCGISHAEASELINKTIIRGNMPEPVRLAHMIAGAITSGENRGKS